MTIFKREPAVLVGLLISILTVIGQVVSGDLTWAAATPVIAGLVVRQLVTPASSPTNPPAGGAVP